MNDPLRQLTALDTPLTPHQAYLLQSIATWARDTSSWPTVAQLDRATLKGGRRIVIADELRAMPAGLLYRGDFRPLPAPTETVPLTIMGLDRCAGFEGEVAAFLAAVRWCARAEQRLEPVAAETDIAVTRRQVARGIRLAVRRDQSLLGFLCLLLREHRWGAHQSGGDPRGEWQFRLGPDVRRFTKVDSVKSYVTTYLGWMEYLEALDRPVVSPAATPAEPRDNAYVDAGVLAALSAATESSPFELSKLLQLLEELNGTCQAGYVYAPHMLLRAVLDHVPPLFGQPHFAGVVSNHGWGRTDRRYMQRLAIFRDQADDALHRQIARDRDVLSAHDMPPAVAVNRLLLGCLDAMTRQ
jgi:hypothetical protein